MPATELIDELIRDGKIIRYYDLRKRTFRDLTGHGAALTPRTATAKTLYPHARGVSAPKKSGASFLVPNSADWNAANDGTIIFFGRWEWNNTGYMFIKGYPIFSFAWIAGANILEMRTNAGTTRRTIVGPRRCLGINYYSSGVVAPSLYENGELVGLFSNVRNVTLTNSDAAWLGINNASTGSGSENIAEALIITNQRLTDIEHRQIYRELMA